MTDQNAQGHRPTTTHAEWGAGNPRLFISRHDERFEHHLTEDVVRIGSATGNELMLTDADPVHATITHDDQDEYVLALRGEGEMNSNPDADSLGGKSEILRTGARFTVGPWTLVFSREEFADHGRPYGGREGGELSDQPSQPERPDYSAEARAAKDIDED
ncbi:FHA domain-containing protein [Microbacterium sp. A84]|uniref:FHA domain-containing protein n=1 Tax=Microbacterium sp. A84 TaxID=3450715 RepID=UPI003F4423B6